VGHGAALAHWPIPSDSPFPSCSPHWRSTGFSSVPAVSPVLVWVERIAGILLIILGLLLVTDRFTLIASWLQG